MVVIKWKSNRPAGFITVTKVVKGRYYYIDCNDFTEGDFPESSLIAWVKHGIAKIVKCHKKGITKLLKSMSSLEA